MALLKTSGEAREILERLRRTGIRPNLWARAALGYSLSLESEPDPGPYGSEGTEFQEPVFFGSDGATLLALLRQRVGQPISDEQVGPLIKLHVERGIRYFGKQYERLNHRGDELFLFLLDQCATYAGSVATGSSQAAIPVPHVDSYAVKVKLGEEKGDGPPVYQTLNGPGTSPHVAIMGRNGTGKTRTALAVLSQITEAALYPIPFLVFDYAKGDVAANAAFIQSTGAMVASPPGQTIPLAPLAIRRVDEHSVKLASYRFRDTVASVVPGIGPKQKRRCLDIIREAYTKLETPDLDDVMEAAKDLYAQNEWPDDSLLACLKDFADVPVFTPSSEGTDAEFFGRTRVIDIHGLPEGLRKLTVFLILDRLYSEVMALPDAPLDSEGNRQLRLIVVIDEAHHYLPCKQPTLENLIREVRSKGVAIWLLSQSPDDFDQGSYNFAREMGLTIVFSCVLERPKVLEALLGSNVNPQSLSQLPAGVALTRTQDSERVVELQAWRP